MINNKQSHHEQYLEGHERLLQGKYITNNAVPFYVEVDIQSELN